MWFKKNAPVLKLKGSYGHKNCQPVVYPQRSSGLSKELSDRVGSVWFIMDKYEAYRHCYVTLHATATCSPKDATKNTKRPYAWHFLEPVIKHLARLEQTYMVQSCMRATHREVRREQRLSAHKGGLQGLLQEQRLDLPKDGAQGMCDSAKEVLLLLAFRSILSWGGWAGSTDIWLSFKGYGKVVILRSLYIYVRVGDECNGKGGISGLG
jgi:hypothetical protein